MDGLRAAPGVRSARVWIARASGERTNPDRIRRGLELQRTLDEAYRPYLFDEAMLETMAAGLDKAAFPDGRVVVTYASDLFSSMLINMLFSLERAGLGGRAFVFALDATTAGFMKVLNVPHVLLPLEARRDGKCRGKFLWLLNALVLGYELLLIEPDCFVFEDPFPFIPPRCDFAMLSDSYKWDDVQKEDLNIGTFLLRPTAAAASMLGSILAQWNASVWDQEAVNAILKRELLGLGVTVCALDAHEFANGGLYFWLPHHAPEDTPRVLVHNNFINQDWKVRPDPPRPSPRRPARTASHQPRPSPHRPAGRVARPLRLLPPMRLQMFFRANLWLPSPETYYGEGRRYLLFDAGEGRPIAEQLHAFRLAAIAAKATNRTVVAPKLTCRGHPAWDLFRIRELPWCEADYWLNPGALAMSVEFRTPVLYEDPALRARYLLPIAHVPSLVPLYPSRPFESFVSDLAPLASYPAIFLPDPSAVFDFRTVPLELAADVSKHFRCTGMRSWPKDTVEAGGSWDVPQDCWLDRHNFWQWV
eukprot:tig00000113_g5585.t1